MSLYEKCQFILLNEQHVISYPKYGVHFREKIKDICFILRNLVSERRAFNFLD